MKKTIRVPLQNKIMNAANVENAGIPQSLTLRTLPIEIKTFELEVEKTRLQTEYYRQEMARRMQDAFLTAGTSKDEEGLIRSGFNTYFDISLRITADESGDMQSLQFRIGGKEYKMHRETFLKNVEDGDFLCSHVFRILAKNKLMKGL